MEKDERHSHPSFGQISFSRVQVVGKTDADFYGSELPQGHYITMKVENSEIQRTLSTDWYFTKGLPLIELRMTSGQFAEMITSLNRGSGTCCTIEFLNGKPVEDMPLQESRKEFVHRKFEERMTLFADEIREKRDRAAELVKKKTLSKADIHELSVHLDWLTQEIENNIPFFAKQFQETMDEIVYEAKTEVENAIQHKINVLGLEELHKQNKLLEDK